MAELTEMTFREDLDSERQVLLGVPATSFSHLCGFKGVGLTEKSNENQDIKRYGYP